MGADSDMDVQDLGGGYAPHPNPLPSRERGSFDRLRMNGEVGLGMNGGGWLGDFGLDALGKFDFEGREDLAHQQVMAHQGGDADCPFGTEMI